MDDIQKKIEELEDEQCAELLVKQVEARVTYQCLHILDHCNTLEEAALVQILGLGCYMSVGRPSP